MEHEAGTATDYLDLLDKLATFLTTHINLDWVVNKNTTSGFTVDGEVYFQGEGLSGTDEIFVNIKTESGVDYWNWIFNGAVDFDGGNDFDSQAGGLPFLASGDGLPRMLLDDSTIGYEFFADNHVFYVVAFVVSSIYETGGGGWLDAFGAPTDYPQPIFVCGCDNRQGVNSSSLSSEHKFPWVDFETNNGRESSLYLRLASGTWARGREMTSSTVVNGEAHVYVWPPANLENDHNIAPTENIDHVLIQTIALVNINDELAQLGEFPGVKWLTGLGISSGDLANDEAGDDHYVVQSTFRTDVNDFVCILQD